MKIASREYVIKKLVELQITPKKKYSQNFLVDSEVVFDIVNKLDIKDDDLIIEIGPGLGSLTEELLEKTNNLIVYEIDQDMINHLRKAFNDKLNIVEGDFLKQDISIYKDKIIKFVSNVPYNVTSDLIEKIITSPINTKQFEFMVQKEVYDRLKQTPGNKEYGSLNVLINYVGKLSVVRKVPRDKFIPAPNVDSIVLNIDFINEIKESIGDRKNLVKLIKHMFLQKRKTILNNLSTYVKDKEKAQIILDRASLSSNLRPEQLSINDYLRLYYTIRDINL